MSKKNQNKLWDGEWWEEHWQGMPEYINNDSSPYKSIVVHFKSKKEMDEFSKIIGYKIKLSTKYIWFPICRLIKQRGIYIDE
jgi:hypothetical protein